MGEGNTSHSSGGLGDWDCLQIYEFGGYQDCKVKGKQCPEVKNANCLLGSRKVPHSKDESPNQVPVMTLFITSNSSKQNR